MTYKILSRAEQEIFRLPEVKNFLRVSHDYDDMWIMELISSAIQAAENFLRLQLLLTRVQIRQDHIHNSEIILPLAPIASVNNVIIKTGAEEEQRIERYELENFALKIPGLPRFKSILVEYTAGYEDSRIIPAAIKQGILLHAAEMYDSHGANSSISDEVRKLYQPYRKMLI